MSRVAQLDSALLDAELQSILITPVLTTLSPSFLASYTPEVHLILGAGLLHLGLKADGASYGAKLQNLVIDTAKTSSKARWKIVLLATLPGYLCSRIRDYMLVNGWPDYPRSSSLTRLFHLTPARRRRELRRLLWDALTRIEKGWASLKLINFLLFLYDGRYPTILFRILELRFSLAQKSLARNVSFDFLNRQLVWEAFTVRLSCTLLTPYLLTSPCPLILQEFLLFLMPLIDLRAIRGWIARQHERHLSSSKNTLTSSLTEKQSKGPLHTLPPSICAICHSLSSASALEPQGAADPIDPMTSTSFLASLQNDATNAGQEAYLPYKSQCCGAKYCYYCIAGAMYNWEKEEQLRSKVRPGSAGIPETGWRCLRCGKPVVEITRWMGEADEDPLMLGTGADNANGKKT